MDDDKELHKKFLKAVEEANAYPKKLPVDVKLKFYAYYKQATENTGLYRPSDSVQIRNAFKLNALFQVGKFTKEEAKLRYIDLVNKYLKG